MDIMERFQLLREYLMIKYILSDEADRIHNPVRDNEKYENFIKAYTTLGELVNKNAEVIGDDPDFPKGNHIITVRYTNGIDDIAFIEDTKRKLEMIIKESDELVISASLNGSVDFTFGYYDIYKAKES